MYPTPLHLEIHRLLLPWRQTVFSQETSPTPTLCLMSVFPSGFVAVEFGKWNTGKRRPICFLCLSPTSVVCARTAGIGGTNHSFLLRSRCSLTTPPRASWKAHLLSPFLALSGELRGTPARLALWQLSQQSSRLPVPTQGWQPVPPSWAGPCNCWILKLHRNCCWGSVSGVSTWVHMGYRAQRGPE